MTSRIFPLPATLIEQQVMTALAEDLGDAGDVTTLATIPVDKIVTANICARQDGILSGLPLAVAAFRMASQYGHGSTVLGLKTNFDATADIQIHLHKNDGDVIAPKDKILTITAPAHTVLTGERIALNFMGHMSGIASKTADFVSAVHGSSTQIAATRKTLPGLRAVQKYAVQCGGGNPHRYGLYDCVMIKDNHIAAAKSIETAIKNAKDYVPHTMKIEIEVDSLDQLKEVLDVRYKNGVDIILLDNMTNDQLRDAVAYTDQYAKTNGISKPTLEASGNVTLDTVADIAKTGVDVISSGALTHSVKNLDIGLDF